MTTLAGQNIIRVAVLALGLSTLSFAAGVAGDLSSIEPPRSGQRVVLRIPPEIPADAPRARPLLSTASAEAAPIRPSRHARRTTRRQVIEAVQATHEESFALLPVVVEATVAERAKPLAGPRVKPSSAARLAPQSAKVA